MLSNYAKYVSLSVLGMIGLSCYILADTFFVANGLGANGLASLNLAISVYSVLHGIGLMLGIGGATKFIFVSHRDKEAGKQVFTHTFLLALCTSLVFVFVGIFATNPLARFLGADVNTLQMTSTYLRVILCFAPFFIINNVLIAFVRNDGNPKLAMTGMLFGSLANVILDYVFVFLFHMGMFGAAFATGLAPVVSMLFLSLHVVKKKNTFHFMKLQLRLWYIKEICALGISSLATELSSAVVLFTFNLIIIRISGNVGIAAYGIVANLALVAVSIFVGIAQGIQPLVSKACTREKDEERNHYLRYAMFSSIVIALFLYRMVYFFTTTLIDVFNREQNIQLERLASEGLHIYFIGFIFAGLNIIISGYLSAIGKPQYGFLISMLRACILLIPLALILADGFGMQGVWFAFPLVEALTMVCAFFFLFRQQKSTS